MNEDRRLGEARAILEKLLLVSTTAPASGAVLNEILSLTEKLEAVAAQWACRANTGLNKRIFVFLNYNIVLAKLLLATGEDGVLPCSSRPLEIALLRSFPLSGAEFAWPGSGSHLPDACEAFLAMAQSLEVEGTLSVIWLLAALLMKQRRWGPAVQILDSTATRFDGLCGAGSSLDQARATHFYLLAVARLGVTDVVGARAHAIQSLNVDPRFQPAMALIAECIVENGDEQDVSSWTSKAAGVPTALSALGCALSNAGKLHEAIDLYRKAIETDVWHQKHSMLNIAVLYGVNGKFEAMKDMLVLLRECIDSGPVERIGDAPREDSMNGVTRVSVCRVEAPRVRPEVAGPILRSDSERQGALRSMTTYMLARAEAMMGHWAGACDLYKQVQMLGTNHIPADLFHQQYALACLYSHQPETARQLILPVWTVDPHNLDSCEIYADALLALGECEQALGVLQVGVEALTMTTDEEQACRVCNNLSMLLACAGKYSEALDIVSEGIRRAPHRLEAVFNKVFLLLRTGQGYLAAKIWFQVRRIPASQSLDFYEQEMKRSEQKLCNVSDSTETPCNGTLNMSQLVTMDVMCLAETIHQALNFDSASAAARFKESG